MRKLILAMAVIFSLFSICYARDVSVKGYYRKDGTYVRPHHRSSPDSDLSNNYGQASSQQRQQYQGYTTLPSQNNDYDNDGVANRHDKDDDNDGISDNSDSSQYSRRNSYQLNNVIPNQLYQNNIYQSQPRVPTYGSSYNRTSKTYTSPFINNSNDGTSRGNSGLSDNE